MALFSTGNEHGYACGCGACAQQHQEHNPQQHAKSKGLGYVAPIAGGNGDGTIGLDAAISQLKLGSSFNWIDSATGKAIPTISYSYAYATWNYGDNNVGHAAILNAAQKAATEKAIGQWESVANINLVEKDLGNATNIVVRQGTYSSAGVAGQAYWKYNQAGTANRHVDVFFDKSYVANPTAGTDAYLCVLHEIGHALGLAHAANYNGAGAVGGKTWLDSQDASVMSYFDGAYVGRGSKATHATGPQLYDIAAIQAIYGANTSYHSGNDTYAIDGTKQAYAIWDGGGVDTISAAGQTTASRIDLREGLMNVNQIGQTTFWVAFNARIENATGGSAGDTIVGNALSNVINGGGGNDVLTGGAGNDTFVFANGGGSDRITDSEAGDRLQVNGKTLVGNATAQGEGNYLLTVSGTDVALTLNGSTLLLKYNNGADSVSLENFQNGDFGIILPGLGNVEPTPTTPTPTTPTPTPVPVSPTPTPTPVPTTPIPTPTTVITNLIGTAKADILSGTTGNDVVYAKSHNDKITGNGGNDKLYGEDGNDVIVAGNGADLVDGGKGNDSLVGAGGVDTLIGGDGTDTITGGAGNDYLTGGASKDIFVYDLSTACGNDVIADFKRSTDKIDIVSAYSGVIRIVYDSDSAMVSFSGGTTIDLLGVTGGLTASDFI